MLNITGPHFNFYVEFCFSSILPASYVYLWGHMFREVCVHFSCCQGKQRERSPTWVAAQQESGYDENATILSTATGRRRRRQDYFWYFFFYIYVSNIWTRWDWDTATKSYRESYLSQSYSFTGCCFFFPPPNISGKSWRKEVRKDGNKSALKLGSCHVWKVSYAI